MKILSTADWHINLHKKKIPYKWQYNRFKQLFNKLLDLENETDVTIIAGDVFDKKPEVDEICLFLEYVNSVKNPTIITSGNHESTSKGDTFLKYFIEENVINNPNVFLIVRNGRVVVKGQAFQVFPYEEMHLNKLPSYIEGDILITHIRGEVPPHITAEYDFEKLRPWGLVLLGDLHFRHKYKDYPIYYPGSPLNTTFDRNEDRDYGVDIVHFESIDNYKLEFRNLNLPKLIRKTIEAGQPLVEKPPHHVIYEVTGSIDNLAKVANNELLDKRIAEKPSEASKIDLTNKTLVEEVSLYLDFIKIDNKQPVIDLFNNLGIRL